jgi:hypothetical protein
MSILSSTNSGRKFAQITPGILEELGWVFHKHQKCWDHWEYTNVEIYQETSFRKEAKEKKGRTPGNWYAIEYIPRLLVGTRWSINDKQSRTIPLKCVGDLDLLENHKTVKTYSI